MKTIYITLVSLALSTFAFAQAPDKALSRVSYNFIHIQDTTDRDNPHKETMLLLIGKNASVFTSYDKINQGIARRKQIEDQMKNQAGSNNFNIRIESVNNIPTSPLDYFYFAKENLFITKERVVNFYLVEEQAPKINWKITKDTASFSGVHCQKATTYFKGRNWIAWYAPDLPFQSGPWKLNGLPGLIITAYDEKKEVQFQFAGMETVPVNTQVKKEKPVEEPKVSVTSTGAISVSNFGSVADSPYLGDEISLPTDAIKTTKKEIDKLKEAREKDPQGFMKAQMAGSNTVVVSGFAMSKSGTPAKKIVVNNPIELPEKSK